MAKIARSGWQKLYQSQELQSSYLTIQNFRPFAFAAVDGADSLYCLQFSHQTVSIKQSRLRFR